MYINLCTHDQDDTWVCLEICNRLIPDNYFFRLLSDTAISRHWETWVCIGNQQNVSDVS